jgi:hypothetical protein
MIDIIQAVSPKQLDHVRDLMRAFGIASVTRPRLR